MQTLIVTLLVLAAGAYATWTLLPLRTRWRLLTRADRGLAARHAGFAGALRRRVVGPLRARTGAALRDAGDCASCGQRPTADRPPSSRRA